ncbi:P27 family phage terminase small subunit [Halomonas dongshanensis]|uniref:P27 family phage terminase small subunit n=1 Tax=Halomonas dongshanensis TaxID=2890835 RepID=A0ABT2ECR8_9GAMM|nr:P27 family phage terminase small subunit [Halomonas dongshanensis]MCS2609374.1 P27 family phage terminase small subunit [Halomonas dongshanensis]
MKTTARRHRSDSAKAAVAAAQAVALGPIDPPLGVRLRDSDRAAWNAIVTARPRDTWTDADLILAAQLARAYGDIAQLETLIDQEGMILGDQVHPACTLLDKMSRRALATARQLKIDTISVVGKSQDINKGAALERDARHGVDEDDGLIPRIVLQ